MIRSLILSLSFSLPSLSGRGRQIVVFPLAQLYASASTTKNFHMKVVCVCVYVCLFEMVKFRVHKVTTLSSQTNVSN